MNIDIVIVVIFLAVLIGVGFLPSKESVQGKDGFLLGGRNVGLWTFVFTNVATWYGGILGVGEYSYRYGISNWVTQGLPYYCFAIIFGIYIVKRVRQSNSITIPERITAQYGRRIGILSAVLVFILTSPAPYLLMTALIISHLFNISLLPAMIGISLSVGVFLLYGGLKSDIFTDVFQFFVMFIGFLIILSILVPNYGGISFLKQNLPSTHFSFTGGKSYLYIMVWWLIALWTFADPGFFQRTQAAATTSIAKKGIIISVAFWFLFDFLTNSIGLYSRALYPNLQNPSISYLVLADGALGAGIRGIFYAAMLATILSTYNSFLFISGTTFSFDIVGKVLKRKVSIRVLIGSGMLISSLISILLITRIPSVIDIWYTIGSLVIPPLFFPVIGSYFPKYSLSKEITLTQMIISFAGGFIWYILLQNNLLGESFSYIEPMLIGLACGVLVQALGLISRRNKSID